MSREATPSSWVHARLGEIVAKLVDGSHNPPDKRPAGLPMLSAINVASNKITFSTHRLIEPAAFEVEDRRTSIRPGDVLLTIVGAIGRSAVVPAACPKFTLQRSVAVLSPIIIDAGFLMYQFESSRLSRWLTDNARGTAQKGIYLKTLSSAEIWLPPLNEQHRIVAKIEELFSELDKGVESLTAAREQLKVYRQAVLKHAFEGKLTADWRAKHKPVDAPQGFFHRTARIRQEAYARAAAAQGPRRRLSDESRELKPISQTPPSSADFKPMSLANGWHWVSLDWLLSVTTKPMSTGPFGTMLKKHEHQSSGVPVLGIENIGPGTFVRGNKIFVTAEKALELAAFEVREHDIVISRSGTVGEICAVPAGFNKVLISTNLIRVSLNTEVIAPTFFVYMFQGGGSVKSQVKALCKGSSREFLNQSILESIVFPLCSLEEQHQVISKIEERLSKVAMLETEIDQALGRIAALRQSILKQAFSGELIAQDPVDEPASVLLERIRAERQRSSSTSPRQTKKRAKAAHA